MTERKPANPRHPDKQPLRAYLSSEAKGLLKQIADELGLNMTSTLEFMIRQEARAMGLTTKETQN